MSDVLEGTPSQVTTKLLARYLPLRDSRAHAGPERHQRKLFRWAAYGLGASGLLVEALLAASLRFYLPGILFGVILGAAGLNFWRMAHRPLQFTPPEPLENLAALALGLGIARTLAKPFPHMVMELDPISSTLSAQADGRDFQVKVDREGLKPLSQDVVGYANSYEVMAETQSLAGRPTSRKIWRRSQPSVLSHRIVWTVSIEGDLVPRPGRPSDNTSLEQRELVAGNTNCVFTLPVNQPDEPGLGHENRTDYISSPMGLHHPEFVGEQIAESLIWLFNPRHH